jgi:hypothetical protein
MDQEADDYGVFCALSHASLRFVIRGDAQRLTVDKIRTSEILSRQPTQTFRDVWISRRSKKQAKKQHPARGERETNLCVRASAITLKRPACLPDAPLKQLTLNAVHVFETDTPPGEAPIEWMLFTTEPIATREDIAAIVDHYRARWVIEEYFKSLKTGCAFEKRQLCSRDTLERALGLFVPMAWALLALRNLGREEPERSPDFVFDANQLRILRILLQTRRRAFAAQPTVRDAMLGIAALGGHIKNNGDPGWNVLGRGMRRFMDAVEIWHLAQKNM